jgi:hypothetical protein
MVQPIIRRTITFTVVVHGEDGKEDDDQLQFLSQLIHTDMKYFLWEHVGENYGLNVVDFKVIDPDVKENVNGTFAN